MTTYEKLPAEEANIEAGLPPPYEEAVGAEESEDPLGLRGRCFLPRVLFCLSLPTAVWALAVLDVFHGIGALASAALLLVVKAEEPAVDAVYARYVGGLASNSTVVTPFFPTTFHGNMTNAEVATAAFFRRFFFFPSPRPRSPRVAPVRSPA